MSDTLLKDTTFQTEINDWIKNILELSGMRLICDKEKSFIGENIKWAIDVLRIKHITNSIILILPEYTLPLNPLYYLILAGM